MIGSDLSEFTTLSASESVNYNREHEDQPVRDVIADRINAHGWTVLDMGCGNGIDAERYPPSRYTGVDISGALVFAAQRRCPHHYFTVRDLRAVGSLPTYDAVMIKSVLEHQHCREDALAILAAALRLARERVFVAWHTPPATTETIRFVEGHFGRLISQSTWLLTSFLTLVGERDLHVDRVGAFELWEITCI